MKTSAKKEIEQNGQGDLIADFAGSQHGVQFLDDAVKGIVVRHLASANSANRLHKNDDLIIAGVVEGDRKVSQRQSLAS